MTEHDEPHSAGGSPEDAGEAPRTEEERPAAVREAPRRRRRKWPWVLAGIFLAPFVLLALWTVIALNWSYSAGDRAGYVQKFSKKGFICKTWEGELAMVNIPGALQERFEFSVRNDSIAQLITDSMGKQVSLKYEQHIGVPTDCFGETQYFVVGVRKLAP